MAAVMQLLLNGEVSPVHILQWLSGGEIVPELANHNKLHQMFVPVFLNYLRSQCTWITQQPQRTTSHQASGKFSWTTEGTDLPDQLNPIGRTSTHNDSQANEEYVVETTARPHRNRFAGKSDGAGDGLSKLDGTSINGTSAVKVSKHPKNSLATVGERFYRCSAKSNHTRKAPDETLSTRGIHQRNSVHSHKMPEKRENILDINDMEAFPPIGTIEPPQPRRITPTPVRNFSKGGYSATFPGCCVMEMHCKTAKVFADTPLQESGACLDEERRLLRKTRDKQKLRMSGGELASLSLECDGSSGNLTLPRPLQPGAPVHEFISADRTLVTDEDKLEVLCEMYHLFLNANLVPNVTVELYFIFQLLTARVKSNQDSSVPVDLFHTVHNCTYFAVCLLEKSFGLLTVLDRSVLRLLSENPNVTSFSPKLVQRLTKTSDSTPPTMLPRLSSIQGVPYNVDDDDRKSFPSDKSFQVFRKQRDLFYELLRDWQNHRLATNWTGRGKFANGVKYLVGLSSNPANLAHLVNLICSQMITCCGKGELVLENHPGEDPLGNLRRCFPEKFEKLQERFILPNKVGGPCPNPSFFGLQEFFCDFLEAAGSPQLNQHLTAQLVAELVQLNGRDFDTGDVEIELDDEVMHEFFSTMHAARLLSKFLGYLTFLPYRSSEPLPPQFLMVQSKLRNAIPPPIDLCAILEEAVAKHTLVLTVPWMVEFLSMMDPGASGLSYYQPLLSRLVAIYMHSSKLLGGKLNSSFLQLLLGWLFETANFPQSLFFTTSVSETVTVERETIVTGKGIDFLAIVDRRLLYSCCPYLGELRLLLGDYLAGIRSTIGEVRKITPVAADSPFSSKPSVEQLQNQLEENFFHLHPVSLKRTVQFVGERVASKAIRLVRNNIIPLARNAVKNKIPDLICGMRDTQDLTAGRVDSCNFQLEEEAEKLRDHITDKSLLAVKSYCVEECQKILPQLLPEETLPEVVNHCVQIAARTAVEKSTLWVKSNVTVDYTYQDIRSQVVKVKNTTLSSEGAKTNTIKSFAGNQREKSPVSKVLNRMRDQVKNLYKHLVEDMSLEDVTKVIQMLDQHILLRHSSHFRAVGARAVGSLSVDWALALIVCWPQYFTENVQDTLIKLWSSTGANSRVVAGIISPRNVHLLSESHASWTKMEVLVRRMVKEGCLLPNDIEENCLSVIKQEFPESVLCQFAIFLKGMLDSCKSSPHSGSKASEFTKLLDWISWFCRQ